MPGLVGVGKRTGAGGTGTRTRAVTRLSPPMMKTLAQTKGVNANELNIRWTGEVEGKLLTEKVDMEECEMQVSDEPAQERRNINVPYKREHQTSSPAVVDSENVDIVDKEDGVTTQLSPPHQYFSPILVNSSPPSDIPVSGISKYPRSGVLGVCISIPFITLFFF